MRFKLSFNEFHELIRLCSVILPLRGESSETKENIEKESI